MPGPSGQSRSATPPRRKARALSVAARTARPVAGALAGAGLLLGVVAFVLIPRTDAAGVRGEVTATVANGFARIVFNLREETDAEVSANNGVMIVSFKRPVDISVEQLPASLAGYVSVARTDPDQKAARFALARKLTVNTMAAGERLYVDLLPEGWVGLPPGLPQEVVEELARRARDAEARLRQQQGAPPTYAPVRARVAQSPTFTRYVFDLPPQVGATTDRGKDRFTLAFDAPLTFDLADAKAALPPEVTAIEAEGGTEKAALQFRLNGPVDVRSFREDNAFVVDIGAVAAPAIVPAAARADTPAQQGAEVRPAPEPQAPAPAAAASGAARPLPEIPPAQSLELTEATPQVPPRPPAVVTPATQPAAPSAADAARQVDTLSFAFPFDVPTPAAMFRRADVLWLVFDTRSPINVAQLRDDRSRTIRDVEVAESGESRIVRLRLARPRLASMSANAMGWTVAISDSVGEPSLPLAIAREIAAHPARVGAAVAFEGPGRIHRLLDPEVGDELIVATGLGPPRGLLKAQDFVEFRALPSVHGVVVQTLADDVTVQRVDDKVVISRPRGLALTDAENSAGPSAPLSYGPGTFDVQTWGYDRQADFLERRTELMNAAADAPEEKRAPARINVARFYVAREMYPEAKAVLDVVLATDREFAEMSNALVMRAIANLMMGRPDAALKDLSNGAVASRFDAGVWRAVAMAGQEEWAQAHEGLRNFESAMAAYPVELQRAALVQAVRAAIEVGDFQDAGRRLSEIDGLGAPDALKPTLALLSGRLAEGLGRPGDALRSYAAVNEAADPVAAAQARLREISLRQKQAALPPEEATTALEALALGWRGDDTENQAMLMLARLYTDAARYREALQLMRVAQAAHPASAVTRQMHDEAAATFDSLFLGARADALSPIEALALFYDFRALTPVGRRGDEMIRRLAERLAGMDLLSQASELLQHQVDHRLQGVARAQVATRLAMFYLMNRKPDRALQALRASRMSELPNDLRNQRLLIEARALSEGGRHDLGLEIVANLDGPEVQRLRADIYWSARRWQQAAEQIERNYGDRWRDFAPLSQTERSDILRAGIGYALAGDTLGTARFRQKYAAKMTEGADRRLFDVVTTAGGRNPADFGEVAKAASLIDTLGTFLRDVRARYPDAQASAAGASSARGS